MAFEITHQGQATRVIVPQDLCLTWSFQRCKEMEAKAAKLQETDFDLFMDDSNIHSISNRLWKHINLRRPQTAI